MQKNPIASTAIGFFCSIGKLVLVEGFRQVGQIVFSWQRGECLSHGRDEPLGGGVFPEDLFHFFQIVDFKFDRFAPGGSAVTSDKVFASRFQRFLGFGNFCIDGGRRTYLQVAYVSFYRGPVGVVNFIPDNDTGCGKVGGSSFVEVKLYISHVCLLPNLISSAFPVGSGTIASPKISAKFRIIPS